MEAKKHQNNLIFVANEYQTIKFNHWAYCITLKFKWTIAAFNIYLTVVWYFVIWIPVFDSKNK